MMDAAFRAGHVGDRVAIEHVDVVGERLEAVREAFGDEQGDAVVGAEPLGVPAQEGRRAAAQVDGDVEHFAAQAVDELFLGLRRMLEVQAAHAAALRGVRVVDLRHRPAPAGLAQFVGAEDAREEAARVADRRAPHAHQAGERRRFDLQAFHVARPAVAALASAPTSAPTLQ